MPRRSLRFVGYVAETSHRDQAQKMGHRIHMTAHERDESGAFAALTLQLEAADRGRDETAELAIKAFELSQSLEQKWLTATYAAKRQILEIICLNFRLDGATLVPTIRKPFDVLVKGPLVSLNRGDRI